MPDVKMKFTADTAQATGGISKMKKELTGLKEGGISFGNVMKTSMMAVAGGVTALTGIVAGLSIGLGKGIKDIIDLSGELKDVSDATGVSVEQVAVLSEEFRQAGVDAEKLQASLAMVSNKLEKSDPNAMKWVKQFGLNIEDLRAMNPGEQFDIITKKIGELSDTGDGLAASKDIFGKIGTDIYRLAKDPAAKDSALGYLGQLPKIMQFIAPTLEAFGDVIDGIHKKFQGFFAGVASQLLPYIQKMGDFIKNLDLSSWGIKFGAVVNGIIKLFEDGKLMETIGAALKLGLLSYLDSFVGLLAFGIYRAFVAGYNMLLSSDVMSGVKDALELKPVEPLNQSDFREQVYGYDLKTWIDEQKNGASDTLKNNLKPRETAIGEGDESSFKASSAVDKKLLSEVYRAMAGGAGSSYKNLTLGETLGGRNKSDIAEVKEAEPRRYEAVLSSLARIGGAKGEMGSTVIDYQRKSLQFQQRTANAVERLNKPATFAKR